MKLRILILFVLQLLISEALMAQVTGQVIDARSRKPLDFVNVFYDGKNVGDQTDENGHFALKEDSTWTELTVSSMGYVTQTIKLTPENRRNLLIRLAPEPRTLHGVTISARRTRYSRKNNPAVDLMRRVIANKKSHDLRAQDYFSYSTYDKMTFSINEFTEKVFDLEEGRRWAFLKDHVEFNKKTGKLILPLTVDETLSSVYYRKDPKVEKTLIKAKNSRGINELINTGEILNTVLKDVFSEVDIYDEEPRLMSYHLKSPIANSAISFYRYYIQDTLAFENDSVIDIGFVPNNLQDMAFSGHLYIMKDSSYQVRYCELNLPKRSDINWVDAMRIELTYEELPTGERVITSNDMLIELSVASWLKKLQVERTTRYFDHSFAAIPKSVFKHIKGPVFTEPDATMHTDDAYWKDYRKVELTASEGQMGSFLDKLTHIKGFKYIMFGMKALIENYIETSDSTATNKFDFGPINTTVSFNDYDKTRFRISGFTTANLHPQIFGSGYVAYGTQSKNVYGRAELVYSFNKKAYLSREFPRNNIHISYWDDVTSPFDKFVPTDKDNVFLALRSSKVDQFNHTREFKLMYDREWYDGRKLTATFTRARNQGVDAMFYQPLGTDPLVSTQGMSALQYDPSRWKNELNTSEFSLALSFEPGATYINTKQRRVKINKDAPIISVKHTIGIDGFLGGRYNYNVTEAGVYKRLYVPGGWGYIGMDIKGGIQWNKVPFPLLIHPAVNPSYIIMDNTFSLLSNQEFLNDRYAQLMFEWDFCGKIFNRIPLLNKLHWREFVGFNMLYGVLTDKNNPAKSNFSDPDLFYFPGHFRADGSFETNTVVMDKHTPYMELRLGIHNIFKLFHVEYVRRLTYLHNPNTHKQGVRFMARVFF